MATANPLTQKRVLEAAERLFGYHGFASTSVRQITDEAKVNLAAANYHFGPKEDLYKEVILRRIRAINEEQLALLTQAEQLAGDQAVPLRAILDTFVRPLIKRARDESSNDKAGLLLISRELADPRPFARADVAREFEPVLARYTQAIGLTIPTTSAPELSWRLQCVIGALLYIITRQQDWERISQGRCRCDDLDGGIRRLIDFCAAGLGASVTPS